MTKCKFCIILPFWESSVNVHFSFRSDNSPDKILCLQMPQLYPSPVHQQSQHWSCCGSVGKMVGSLCARHTSVPSCEDFKVQTSCDRAKTFGELNCDLLSKQTCALTCCVLTHKPSYMYASIYVKSLYSLIWSGYIICFLCILIHSSELLHLLLGSHVL